MTRHESRLLPNGSSRDTSQSNFYKISGCLIDTDR